MGDGCGRLTVLGHIDEPEVLPCARWNTGRTDTRGGDLFFQLLNINIIHGWEALQIIQRLYKSAFA